MRHIRIEEHDQYCNATVCNTCGKRHTIFFLNPQFYLVTYQECLFDLHEEYKIIMEAVKDSIHGELFNTYTSVNNLSHIRKIGFIEKDSIPDIHFVYKNRQGREHCVYSITNYLDRLCDSGTIAEDYRTLKKYIYDNKYTNLDCILDRLVVSNAIFESDTEIIKTTELFIKLINGKTTENA